MTASKASATPVGPCAPTGTLRRLIAFGSCSDWRQVFRLTLAIPQAYRAETPPSKPLPLIFGDFRRLPNWGSDLSFASTAGVGQSSGICIGYAVAVIGGEPLVHSNTLGPMSAAFRRDRQCRYSGRNLLAEQHHCRRLSVGDFGERCRPSPTAVGTRPEDDRQHAGPECAAGANCPFVDDNADSRL